MPEQETVIVPTESEAPESLSSIITRAALRLRRPDASIEPQPTLPNSTPNLTPEQAAWVEAERKKVRVEVGRLHQDVYAAALDRPCSSTQALPDPLRNEPDNRTIDLLRRAVKHAFGR